MMTRTDAQDGRHRSPNGPFSLGSLAAGRFRRLNHSRPTGCAIPRISVGREWSKTFPPESCRKFSNPRLPVATRLTATIVALVFSALALAARAADPAPTNAAPALRLTIAEAMLMALENNPSFRVQRLAPEVTRTFEDAARAEFDPALGGQLSRSRQTGPSYALVSGSTSTARVVTEATTAEAGASVKLPTGTALGLDGSTDIPNSQNSHTASRVGVTVTQPLLNGAGTSANLAVLRQARLDTAASVYELQGFAISLVADVEHACWDHVLAQRQLAIYRDSLGLAERQLEEVRGRIRVGKLADIEAAAAEAEVARRHEDLINAESACSTTRLRVLRLLNPARPEMWSTRPEVTDAPAAPEAPLGDMETYAAAALKLRPDLRQAQLSLERGDLEIVKTRNGLLPKLDLFITLGRSAYAGSFSDTLLKEEDRGWDTLAGVRLDYPLGNRAAKAAQRRAVLNREQAGQALTNLCLLAQEDVRSAWVEAQRTREQVAATAATRRLQERTAEAETEKLRVGKSTSLLVAQTQRDLLQSRVAEVEALIRSIEALLDLYRSDGSLLTRRGLVVPE